MKHMRIDAAISAEGLAKSFGKIKALDGVDLKVHSGTVMALLGPNGAGKTTVVRILATLMRPDAGQAKVAGYDVVREAGNRQLNVIAQCSINLEHLVKTSQLLKVSINELC